MRFGAGEPPSDPPLPSIPPPPDEGLKSDAFLSASTISPQARPESARWFGRRRSLAILAILVVVLASAGIGAIAGARSQENHWKPLYNRAVAAAAHSKAATLSIRSSPSGMCANHLTPTTTCLARLPTLSAGISISVRRVRPSRSSS
jgi:hypothetical protein